MKKLIYLLFVIFISIFCTDAKSFYYDEQDNELQEGSTEFIKYKDIIFSYYAPRRWTPNFEFDDSGSHYAVVSPNYWFGEPEYRVKFLPFEMRVDHDDFPLVMIKTTFKKESPAKTLAEYIDLQNDSLEGELMETFPTDTSFKIKINFNPNLKIKKYVVNHYSSTFSLLCVTMIHFETNGCYFTFSLMTRNQAEHKIMLLKLKMVANNLKFYSSREEANSTQLNYEYEESQQRALERLEHRSEKEYLQEIGGPEYLEYAYKKGSKKLLVDFFRAHAIQPKDTNSIEYNVPAPGMLQTAYDIYDALMNREDIIAKIPEKEKHIITNWQTFDKTCIVLIQDEIKIQIWDSSRTNTASMMKRYPNDSMYFGCIAHFTINYFRPNIRKDSVTLVYSKEVGHVLKYFITYNTSRINDERPREFANDQDRRIRFLEQVIEVCPINYIEDYIFYSSPYIQSIRLFPGLDKGEIIFRLDGGLWIADLMKVNNKWEFNDVREAYVP